jgi:hypothetical protein
MFEVNSRVEYYINLMAFNQGIQCWPSHVESVMFCGSKRYLSPFAGTNHTEA